MESSKSGAWDSNVVVQLERKVEKLAGDMATLAELVQGLVKRVEALEDGDDPDDDDSDLEDDEDEDWDDDDSEIE